MWMSCWHMTMDAGLTRQRSVSRTTRWRRVGRLWCMSRPSSLKYLSMRSTSSSSGSCVTGNPLCCAIAITASSDICGCLVAWIASRARSQGRGTLRFRYSSFFRHSCTAAFIFSMHSSALLFVLSTGKNHNRPRPEPAVPCFKGITLLNTGDALNLSWIMLLMASCSAALRMQSPCVPTSKMGATLSSAALACR